MVIQHNLAAMNGNRVLNITALTQAKSTERLSSGYRINRAADDAAGLSISEKMRKQIRGLTQASTNANDGISAVQTAEGALGEVQDMLQRMNELAIKAANGTNSEDDRNYIQNEIDLLTTEIDRIAETTKFNETYLLKGDRDKVRGFSLAYSAATAASGSAFFESTADANGFKLRDLTSANLNSSKSAEVNEVLRSLRDNGVSVTYNGHWNQAGNSGSGSAEKSWSLKLTGSAAEKYKVVTEGTTGKVFNIVDADGAAIISSLSLDVSGAADQSASSQNLFISVTSKISAKSVTAQATSSDISGYYDKDGNRIGENALTTFLNVVAGEDPGDDPVITAKSGHKPVYDAVGNETELNIDSFTAKQDIKGKLMINLHVGADAKESNEIIMCFIEFCSSCFLH